MIIRGEKMMMKFQSLPAIEMRERKSKERKVALEESGGVGYLMTCNIILHYAYSVKNILQIKPHPLFTNNRSKLFIN